MVSKYLIAEMLKGDEKWWPERRWHIFKVKSAVPGGPTAERGEYSNWGWDGEFYSQQDSKASWTNVDWCGRPMLTAASWSWLRQKLNVAANLKSRDWAKFKQIGWNSKMYFIICTFLGDFIQSLSYIHLWLFCFVRTQYIQNKRKWPKIYWRWSKAANHISSRGSNTSTSLQLSRASEALVTYAIQTFS